MGKRDFSEEETKTIPKDLKKEPLKKTTNLEDVEDLLEKHLKRRKKKLKKAKSQGIH